MLLLLVEVMQQVKIIKMETKRKMIKIARVTLQATQLLVQGLATTVLLGFLSVVALVAMVVFPLQEQIRRLKRKEKRLQRQQQ
ncbi:MAG: hypothetical protein EB010_08400 [Acidimicrobiia bacterium]|nr:hypothetical protein [Actinomycetota bacterium]NDE59428.1 hypothetical protein [Acidimicrobiia bacterium]